MRKILLGFIFALGSAAHADTAALEPHPVDLSNTAQYRVISALYSATETRALVGVVDLSRGIATYVDCEAPRKAADQAVSLKMLLNCQNIPGAWFILNDENVATLNRVFPAELQTSYVESQEAANQERRDHRTMFINVAPIVISGAVGSGVMTYFAQSLQFTWTGRIAQAAGDSRVLRVFKSFGKGLGVGVGGAIMIADLVGLWTEEGHTLDRPLEPLENRLVISYRQLLRIHPEAPLMEFSSEQMALSFETVRNAVIRSIAQIRET